MNTKELIFDLCSAYGVSGCEEPVINTAKKYLEDFSEIETDSNCNLMATFGNINADKTILIDAHIDRIGFIVTQIDTDGFVKVDKCGGIDTRTLLDTELVLQSNPEIKGVVCCMPPHLSDGKEDKAVEMDKIWVDFGMSYDEISRVVSIGDFLTYYTKPILLLNNKIASACLDNRCGVAAVIKCAEILSKKELNYKVKLLLSSQEETFATGAKTGAYKSAADESVVVDVSFALQPDISGQYASIELGKGPMICLSPILNTKMSKTLVDIAISNNIPYQLEPISLRTGTNADHISVTGGGIKTALVSIPQKYMHTQSEVVSLIDVENTAILIAQYVISGGAFVD